MRETYWHVVKRYLEVRDNMESVFTRFMKLLYAGLGKPS